MDDLKYQCIPTMLQIRNTLQDDCYDRRCSQEGEVSLLTKKVINMRKVNNPRVGIQYCPTKDCVPFHTHLNARRIWYPPCHGDLVSAGIRAALDPSQHLDYILAREGIYIIDASELGNVFREDARRIVMNPEWKIHPYKVKSWVKEEELALATEKVLRSWFYAWPILSGGAQFDWYRNHGLSFWGPGAISRSIHKPLLRIIEQVEVTKGEQFNSLWREYENICHGVGIRIYRHMDEMPYTI